MAPRASNCLTVADYVEALQVHIPASSWSTNFQSNDFEYVVASYLPFFLHCSARTNRISSMLLQQAVVEVHAPAINDAEALKFSQAIVATFSLVWRKLGNCTSAKSQSPETQALMAVMRLHKPDSEHPEHPEPTSPTSSLATPPAPPPESPGSPSMKSVLALLDHSEAHCTTPSPPPKTQTTSWETLMKRAEDAMSLHSGGCPPTSTSCIQVALIFCMYTRLTS